MKCARCSRELKSPIYMGGMAFGSTCAVIVGAAAPRRRAKGEGKAAKDGRARKAAKPAAAPEIDPLQPDLFAEAGQ